MEEVTDEMVEAGVNAYLHAYEEGWDITTNGVREVIRAVLEAAYTVRSKPY